MPKSRILEAISKLEKLQIIVREHGSVKLVVDSLHLPRNSPYYQPWRNLLKIMATHRIDNLPEDQYFSFAAVFSADEPTRKEIHSRFLNFLREVEDLVSKSPLEEVFQVGFELFPWTKP